MAGDPAVVISIMRPQFSITALAMLALPLLACSVETGPSVEFKPAATASTTGSAERPAATEAATGEEEPISPRLGFVQNGEATALENGGRVPLGEGTVAEVFIAPYPPDWQTDVHLFILDSETFEPVTDVEVELEYEMVYMDHGIDGLPGTKVSDGHYVMPLDFLMYGDWSVDTTVQLPEGKKHLRFIVKFSP
ncbi:MAG: hypothetical protein O3A47_05375 [Chloroflexi bacterium]|nr:hypothetical protein [Chloroflexota bacterium]